MEKGSHKLSVIRLRIFCEVGRTKNFHVAAENLGISTSAVSQNISTLEDELGLILFERGRINNLTDAGEFLYANACPIVEQMEELSRKLRAYKNGKIGKICLATNSSINDFIISLCKTFSEKNTEVQLSVITAMPEQICKMILSHEVNFGIIVGKIKHPELVSIPIGRAEVIIVVGKNHPWCGKEVASPYEISRQTFIYGPTPPAYIQSILTVLGKNNIHVNKRLVVVDTMESIRRTLKCGDGISALIKDFVAEDLNDGSLYEVPLKGGPLYVDICRIMIKNKHTSLGEREFIEYIDRKAQERFCNGQV